MVWRCGDGRGGAAVQTEAMMDPKVPGAKHGRSARRVAMSVQMCWAHSGQVLHAG